MTFHFHTSRSLTTHDKQPPTPTPTPQPPRYDAIVVGAGPGGAATAAGLARAGVRVLLLDKATFPRDKACGEYTSPETGRVLARLGALEWVEREARPRQVRAMKIIGPSGVEATLDYRWAGARATCWRRRVCGWTQPWPPLRSSKAQCCKKECACSGCWSKAGGWSAW